MRHAGTLKWPEVRGIWHNIVCYAEERSLNLRLPRNGDAVRLSPVYCKPGHKTVVFRGGKLVLKPIPSGPGFLLSGPLWRWLPGFMRNNKMKRSGIYFLSACVRVVACSFAFALPPIMPVQAALGVVSLMPSYTEIIFELGAGPDLIGVSSFCDWPPGARRKEKVGDYLRPNIEKIYSLKPDMIFAGAWKGSSVAQELRNAGMKVIELPEEHGLDDIFSTINIIAGELGRKKEAVALIQKMKTGLNGAPFLSPRPSVYLELDEGGWTAGKLSFLSDAIGKAGGKNIFAGEDKGYFQVSWEAVVKKDPDAVILLSGSAADFSRRPLASGLKAVKSGRVFTGMARDAFLRPGPRLAAEIKRLKAWLARDADE